MCHFSDVDTIESNTARAYFAARIERFELAHAQHSASMTVGLSPRAARTGQGYRDLAGGDGMRHVDQRTAGALGLVALVMILAACTSSGTKGTARPEPTDAGTTSQPPAAAQDFVSQRYGFQLTLTKDWSASDAQSDWDGKKLQGLSSPAFADFEELRTGRAFTVGAAPLAEGTQLAAWRAALALAVPPGCVDPTSPATNVTLGGEPALTWTTDCGDAHPTKIAAMHGGRGYVAIFELSPAEEKAADRSLLQSILRSFRFTG